jgi:polysaccharide biosynthesis protein PslH
MNNSRLKILQIAPKVPFPLDNGGKIAIYGITNYLSERNHQIDFVTYRKDSDYNYSFRELSKISNPYILDVQTDNSVMEAFFNLFSKVPYNVAKYYTSVLKNFLENYFKTNKPDIIHVDNVHLAWIIDIIREYTDCPAVLRQQNVEMLIMKRYSDAQKNFFLKQYSRMQYKKFITYEPEICRKFDCCVMITEQDRKYLLELDPEIQTEVIPAGVDSKLLERTPVPVQEKTLFHLGSLKWLPNFDSLTWFLSDIFPGVVKEVPDVKLYIYSEGTNDFRVNEKLTGNVVIKGWVEDIFSEIADKDLAVVPLRIGGGMRVKLVELMALGKNILSTSVGKEGLDITEGVHMQVADTAEEFRKSIVEHLNSPHKKFNSEAREFVRENYTWEKLAEKLEKVYFNLLSIK